MTSAQTNEPRFFDVYLRVVIAAEDYEHAKEKVLEELQDFPAEVWVDEIHVAS